MKRKFVVVCCFVISLASCFAAELRVERRKPLTANVGVVSVGLDTYWKQCPGLLDDMKKKENVFVRKCEAHQVKVSRFGMSDNPVAAKAIAPCFMNFRNVATHRVADTDGRYSFRLQDNEAVLVVLR